VVVADQTNVFTVSATDADVGDSLTYQWQFGDGVTNAASPLSTAAHAYADCGPFAASVAVNDGHTNIIGRLTASVPCSNQVTALTVKLDFVKGTNDTISLTLTGPAPGNFIPVTGEKLTLDVGGVVVTFTNVTIKGKSLKGSGPNGSVTGTVNTKTGIWTLKASLKKGSWQTALAKIGMVDQVVPKPGTVLTVPVLLLLDDESLAGQAQVTYTATTKVGQAKKNK